MRLRAEKLIFSKRADTNLVSESSAYTGLDKCVDYPRVAGPGGEVES